MSILERKFGKIGLLVRLAVPGRRLDIGEADELQHFPHAVVDRDHECRHAGLHADDAAVETAAEAEIARGHPAPPLVRVEEDQELVFPLPFFGMLVFGRAGDAAARLVIDDVIVVAGQGQVVGDHLVLDDIACDAVGLKQRMRIDDRIGDTAEIAAEGDLLRFGQARIGEGGERALHRRRRRNRATGSRSA